MEEVKKKRKKTGGCTLSLSAAQDLYPPQSKVMVVTWEHGLSPRLKCMHLMRYGPADNYKQPLWIKAIKPEGTFDPALYHRRDLV